MSIQFDREGLFRGAVLDASLGTTPKQGYPQVVAKVLATEMYDEETADWIAWDYDMGAVAYLCLIGTSNGDQVTTFSYDAVKEVFGWDGRDFVELKSMLASAGSDGAQCQFRMVEDDYEDRKKDGFKLKCIYKFDAPPTRELRQMDDTEVANLNAQFGALLAGKAAPVAAKGKGKNAAPKGKPATSPKLPPKAGAEAKLKANDAVDAHVAADAEARAEREEAKVAKRQAAKDAAAAAKKAPPSARAKKTGPPVVVPSDADECDNIAAWEAMVEVRENNGLEADSADEAYRGAVFAVVGELETDEDTAKITGAQWAEIRDLGVATLTELIG